MTKLEVITNIAYKHEIKQEDVMTIVNAFMAEVKKSLAVNEPVYLRGFGTFHPQLRKMKIGRNISKGIPVVIPPQRVPAFRPSPEFKSEIRRR